MEDIKEKLLDFWEGNKWQAIVIIMGIIIAIFLMLPRVNDDETNHKENFSNSILTMKSSKNIDKKKGNKSTDEYIYIDIKGAVRQAGMYKVKSTQRLANIIQQAGGLTDDADISKLNYAHKLSDQMMVYVPKKNENYTGNLIVEINTTNNDNNTNNINKNTDNEAVNNGKVNLNTASKDQLTQLNGIGDKKAEQIITYRQENGNFKSIEELKNVSGIGSKTFEAISDKLAV